MNRAVRVAARKAAVAADRVRAAGLVREIRAMWPNLHGEWSRRQWNHQCRIAGRGYLTNAARFREANE